jgi:hypothetical protein
MANSKKNIIVYAFNEDYTGFEFLKMYSHPEESKQAHLDFTKLLDESIDLDSNMCTQEHFAKVILLGKESLARAGA